MKNLILAKLSDLVLDFIYYDRKEDEELSAEQLQKAIKEGEITIEEIVSSFEKGLKASFDTE